MKEQRPKSNDYQSHSANPKQDVILDHVLTYKCTGDDRVAGVDDDLIVLF